eukprot:m.128130 g.128130  ORF g.128130 m.128130 type:complete len:293 (+) comp37943_c0_seq17:1237-2115(+)
MLRQVFVLLILLALRRQDSVLSSRPKRMAGLLHRGDCRDSSLNCSCSLEVGEIFCSYLSQIPVFDTIFNQTELGRFRILIIESSNLGNVDLSVTPLSPLRSLSYLAMDNNVISSFAGFSDICKISSLSYVSLQNNTLRVVPKGISECRELTEIELNNNLITSSGLGTMAFSGMMNLRSLDLSENRNLIHIARDALHVKSGTLDYIDIQYCGIQSIEHSAGLSSACDDEQSTGNRPTMYLSKGNDYICDHSLSWICRYLTTCMDSNLRLTECHTSSGQKTNIISFCRGAIIFK